MATTPPKTRRKAVDTAAQADARSEAASTKPTKPRAGQAASTAVAAAPAAKPRKRARAKPADDSAAALPDVVATVPVPQSGPKAAGGADKAKPKPRARAKVNNQAQPVAEHGEVVQATSPDAEVATAKTENAARRTSKGKTDRKAAGKTARKTATKTATKSKDLAAEPADGEAVVPSVAAVVSEAQAKPRQRGRAARPRAEAVAAVAPSGVEAEAPTDSKADKQAAMPQATAYSEVLLGDGLERRLFWRAGTACPAALKDAVQSLLDDQDRLPREQHADARQWLPALLTLAAEHGHELRVATAVWSQLAWARDMHARVQRLERLFPLGPADSALAGLLTEPLAPFQWEAALYAVCVGRALLADDLGLGPYAVALAAWQLWRHHLGVERALLVCQPERLPAWREALGRLPTSAGAAELVCCTPEQLSEAQAAGPELLIVDQAAELLASTATMADLRALGAPHLLLLSGRELVFEPQTLAVLVDWLDEARRGPWAALTDLLEQSEGREPPRPRALRDALRTVMLSRRRQELGAKLPRQWLNPVWVDLGSVQLAEQRTGQQALHGSVQRWQRLGDLGGAEQLQLLSELQRLRRRCVEAPEDDGALVAPGEAHAAKSEALLALLPQIVPTSAARVVVCAQSDQALQTLHSRLDTLGLATLRIGRDQLADARADAARAWREDAAQGQVLLLADQAARGLVLWSDAQPAPALVHLDLPWSPLQLEHRALSVAGSEARGLHGWQLLASGSVEQGLWQAHQRLAVGQGLPAATLDGEPAQPFLEGPELDDFMGALTLVATAE